jgi:excisionase family DNA binding protein
MCVSLVSAAFSGPASEFQQFEAFAAEVATAVEHRWGPAARPPSEKGCLRTRSARRWPCPRTRPRGAVLRLLLAPTPTQSQAEPKPDAVLTLDEAAAYLRKGRSWLFHQLKKLRLGFRSGRRVLFRRSTLDRYLAACERRSRS